MFYWLFNNVCTSKGAAHAHKRPAVDGGVMEAPLVFYQVTRPRSKQEKKGRNKSSSDMSQALCLLLELGA